MIPNGCTTSKSLLRKLIYIALYFYISQKCNFVTANGTKENVFFKPSNSPVPLQNEITKIKAEINRLSSLYNSTSVEKERLSSLETQLSSLILTFDDTSSDYQSKIQNLTSMLIDVTAELDNFKNLHEKKEKEREANLIASIKINDFEGANTFLKQIELDKTQRAVETYVNQSGNVDLFLQFVDRVREKLYKCRLLYDLSNALNDPSKLINIIGRFKDCKDYTKIGEMRNHLKRLTTEIVKNTSITLVGVKNEIYRFDKSLYMEALKDGVNNVYDQINLNEYLKFVHSLDQRISTCGILCEIFKSKETKKSENIITLAINVKTIINDINYVNERNDMKKIIEKFYENLPSCVKIAIDGRRTRITNANNNAYLRVVRRNFNQTVDASVITTAKGTGYINHSNEDKWVFEHVRNNKWYIKNFNFYLLEYLFADSEKYNQNYHYVRTSVNRDKRKYARFEWILLPEKLSCKIKNVAFNEFLVNSNIAFDNFRNHVFTSTNTTNVNNGSENDWKFESNI